MNKNTTVVNHVSLRAQLCQVEQLPLRPGVQIDAISGRAEVVGAGRRRCQHVSMLHADVYGEGVRLGSIIQDCALRIERRLSCCEVLGEGREVQIVQNNDIPHTKVSINVLL